MSLAQEPEQGLRVPAHTKVLGQLGQSLDGRIATASGHSHYINGPEALDHLHRLRAWADAVVVGVGTVVADDPQLTVRRCAGSHPVRVVLDPTGRMPADARCRGEPAATLQLCLDGAASPPTGVRQMILPAKQGMMAPENVIGCLAAEGLHRVLVEGGAKTLSTFLAAGMLDRLHLLVGSVIIGSGPFGITLPAIPTLDEALRPGLKTVPLGPTDVLLDLDLKP